MSLLHRLTSVLLLEDDSVDAEAIQRELAKAGPGYSVEWVDSVEAALAVSDAITIDVILTDLKVTDSFGMDTVRALREKYPQVPIIALTGSNDDIGLMTIRAGASDFIPKNNVQSALLCRAIRYSLERHRMRNELHQANAKLREKNQRLAKMWELSERFVDNVSHEFRAPLTVIREYASLLCDEVDGSLNSKQKARLQTLINRTDEMSRMVDDLLDTSRVSSGLVRVARQRVEFKEVVNSVVEMLNPMAVAKRIELQVEGAVSEMAAFCDPHQVQRILINLVHNAIKFTSPGGCIKIDAKRSGHHVHLSVSDNGCGISADDVESIFERFEQVNGEPRLTNSRGFGLGLSIASALSTLNLGELSVVSEPGKGSRFTLKLPLDDARSVLKCYLDQRSNGDEEDGDLAVFSVAVDCPQQEDSKRAGAEDRTVGMDGEVCLGDQAIVYQHVNDFLSSSFMSSDLVLQRSEGTWIVYAKATPRSVPDVVKRINAAWESYCQNCNGVDLPPLLMALQINANVLGQRNVLQGFLSDTPTRVTREIIATLPFPGNSVIHSRAYLS